MEIDIITDISYGISGAQGRRRFKYKYRPLPDAAGLIIGIGEVSATTGAVSNGTKPRARGEAIMVADDDAFGVAGRGGGGGDAGGGDGGGRAT